MSSTKKQPKTTAHASVCINPDRSATAKLDVVGMTVTLDICAQLADIFILSAERRNRMIEEVAKYDLRAAMANAEAAEKSAAHAHNLFGIGK